MTRRGVILALALVLVVLAGCSGLPEPEPTTSATTSGDGTRVTVVHVVDGDTMDVRFPDGHTDRVRLLGVDTPEPTGDVTPGEFEGVPDTPAARECLRRWGDRASAFATRRLAGETVTLRFDPESDRRGSYDRLLAYLDTRNGTFNRVLLAQGYARIYDSEFTRRDEYAAAERAARRANRGLWTCRTPTETAGALSIRVHADAAGPDGDNLDDEYVTLTNTGDDALDVAAWTVRDAAGHAYTFSTHALPAGGTLTLHTGRGTPNATHVYWNASRPVWNNDGDTVTVTNATGGAVARTTY